LGPLDSTTDWISFIHLVPDPGDSQTVAGDVSLPADGGATGQWICRMAYWDCLFIAGLSQSTTVSEAGTLSDGNRLRLCGCCVNMVVTEHNKQ
jgi:hypothetical protein